VCVFFLALSLFILVFVFIDSIRHNSGFALIFFFTGSVQRVIGGSCVGQQRRSAGRARWYRGHRGDAYGGRLGGRLWQRSPVPFALKTSRDNEYGVSERYNTFVVFRLFCTFYLRLFFLVARKTCASVMKSYFFLSNLGRLCCCRNENLKIISI
jgi:hypothetical protein